MPQIPEDLKIHRAREADLAEMARIHHAAYPGIDATLEQRIETFRSDPCISLEDRWVCRRNGRVIGQFNLYNFRMFRDGEIIPVGGIGGVAVAPEARREKVAYWMMLRAVQIMEQNSIPLSALYPFRHKFYHKLGWGKIGKVTQYRFDPRSLPAYPGKEHVTPVVTYEDQEDVMSCYRSWAENRNGLFERDDPVWHEKTFKNELCYGYRSPKSGDLEGYVLYSYKPLPFNTHFIETDLSIRELVWSNSDAFRGLISFLASQNGQVRSIEYHDQSGLPFEQILSEPIAVDGNRNIDLGGEFASVGSNQMGRIVQLRKILTLLGQGSKAKGKVTLHIQDDLNPENSKPVTVDFDNGHSEFPRNGSTDVTLSTDIATLSTLYWGAIRLPVAVWLGLVEIEGKGNARFLERLFDVSAPVCLDYF